MVEVYKVCFKLHRKSKYKLWRCWMDLVLMTIDLGESLLITAIAECVTDDKLDLLLAVGCGLRCQ